MGLSPPGTHMEDLFFEAQTCSAEARTGYLPNTTETSCSAECDEVFLYFGEKSAKKLNMTSDTNDYIAVYTKFSRYGTYNLKYNESAPC